MKNEKLEKMLIENGEGEKYKALEDGMKRLLRFYYLSKDEKNLSKMLIVNDIIWDNELEDFTKALKEYNVKELVFSSTWSSAIEAMMYLLDNGYTTDGTIVYEKNNWFGKEEIKKGIKLILK